MLFVALDVFRDGSVQASSHANTTQETPSLHTHSFVHTYHSVGCAVKLWGAAL